jgi:RHS repeat-associated protein
MRVLRMRGRSLVAVGSAFLLFAALAFVAVTLYGPSRPSVPVQQTATAAGRPHRVSAGSDIGRIVDGRFVADASSAGRKVPGPVAANEADNDTRVPGAVSAAAAKPKPLELPARGKSIPETGSSQQAPPAANKSGFNPKTSRALAPTRADQTVYSNVDGTKTAFEYEYPVNYQLPDGKWAPISTSLVPVTSAAASAGAQASTDAWLETLATASPSPSGPPPLSASVSPSPSVSSSPAASSPASPSGSSSPAAASPASPSGSSSPAASSSASPSPSASSSPTPAGGWTEKSEADPESFAPSADAPALVTLPVDGSHTVSFGISGAGAVTGAASGGTVSYADARPDSTISFAAGTGLVKESIVLSSPSAPDTWVFPLDLKGLRAQMGPDGIVEFTDAAGKVLAYVPRGYMTDSHIDPHSGDGAMSSGVTYSLVTVGGRQAIKMTLAAAWLDSKSRVYPVTVDPSVYDAGADGTAYALDGSLNSGGSEIKVGTWDGGSDMAESYLDFSGVASELSNDTVLGVRLGLFNTWSYSCSPREVYVYPVTSSWSVTGTSVPSTGSEVGRSSFATGWVPYGSTSSPCPSSWEGIDLDQAGTNLVNGWTHGSADYGLALGASDSDSFGWKKFASGSSPDGNPFLAITWTSDGASYSLASRHAVTNVTPTSAGAFAINVTNTGSSTWDANNANGYEISSTAYYGYTDSSKGIKAGEEVQGSQTFTKLPSTVAPRGSVKVNAAVAALPGGPYRIVFDMYSGMNGGTPKSFASQGIPDFEIGLYVPTPPPVVTAVYPPTEYISTTLQQQLSTTATGDGTVTYDFTLTCKPLTGQTCVDSSVTSGWISKPYWTPPAADLDWDTPYQWQVVVKSTSGSSSSTTTVGPVDIQADVPQPAITSDLGTSSGQDYQPLSGNYTTSATDAAVKSVGPPLEIDRTYNSLDPRSSGAFGAGWSSVLDTSLRNDGSTVTVTLPDGQQMTFGKNGDGTYAAPMGSPDALVPGSSGTWTLRTASGDFYRFTSAGLITSITDRNGYAQNFTPGSGNEVTTITDAISGRALTLTWSQPSGAKYPHVSSVTTPGPSAGASGYMWTYSYTGDELTQACAPATTGPECTTYTYGSGSHYWSSVLDANPRVYYQFGDASGATSAADEVDANLGTTDGTYHNVTLGAAGKLTGTGETAASFNGTSSYVSLPDDLLTDGTDVSIGLWFKAASGTSGVLFGYSAGTVASGSEGNHAVPALYIGTNGELYGELYQGSQSSAPHSSVKVNDGNWHYAVLSASSSSQTLYLDGVAQGTLAGQVNQLNMVHDSVGAGFWGGGWPEAGVSGTIGYFHGEIGQVAVYPQPLSAAAIGSQYALAGAASPELTQVTLPSGKIYEEASYDSDTARLSTYTDPHGGQWTISQPLASGTKASSDAHGYVVEDVTVAGPEGQKDTYGYDVTDGSRLISYDNGADPPQAYGYDAAGFLTTVVDQNGNLVCLTNDIHGNVLTRTWYPAEGAALPGTGPGIAPANCGGSTASSADCWSTGAPCTTFYGYAAYNTANPVDPTNDELTSVRDGRSASATDATYETTYSYNTIGQLTFETTPATSDFTNGRTTRYVYSTGTETAANGGTIPAGLLESETTPGGAVTSYSYDTNGDLAQVKEPSGRYTDYTYDGLGRPVTSTVHTSTGPSAGETTSYTYTPTSQQASVTYPAVTNSVTNVAHQLEDTYAYDADNNLLTKTESDLTGRDPSRTTTYTYNDHDEVATITQPAGATAGGTSQSQGASSANPGGATTGYGYDAFGNVTQVTDPNGNQYRYAYNEYQEPTQEILYTPSTNESSVVANCAYPATQDADGGCDLVLKSSAYDPAGLLAATTDAMGRTTNYGYDNNETMIESKTQQVCSASSPCTSMGSCTPTAQCTSGSVATMTTYAYDGAGNKISEAVSGPGGMTTTDYNYDAAGRLTSEVQDATPSAASSSSGYLNRTTAYTYDADNHVLSKTVGTGSALAVTDYGYDTAGDMTSQAVQDGSTSLETTWTYDQNGLPLSMTTPEGNASGAVAADYTTNYTYDPAGNMVTETGPPVSVSTYASQTAASTRPVTTYGYDTFGDKTQVQDPDKNVTTTAYDGDGRTTSVTQAPYTPPGGLSAITATASYAYDENGNLVSVTYPSVSAADPSSNVISYTYDALGDVTSETDPQLPGQSAPGTWNYSYDADGEQLSTTDPVGNKTQQTYDYFGHVATSTDALNNTTGYAYDYLGDQTMTDTPDGSVTTSGYDDLGELASVTDGASNKSTYSYDDQGHLAYAYNPDGTFEAYGYDQAGQMTSVTDYGAAPAGQASPVLRSESFGYDLNGDQTSAKDWNGNTTTYSHDAAGELTSQVQPVTATSSITTTYGYDAAGNRTSVTDGNQNTTWTTYNTWNLPEQVIEPTTPAAPSTSDTTWQTAYNAQGEPSTVTEPGGVSLSYGYDPLGDILSESGSGASASTPDLSFSYYANQQMQTATSGTGTDSFTYNADGDLSGASGPSGTSSYTYNNDGLVASETSAAGKASYTYDAADRLATQTDPLTGSTLTWAYNSDSHPTSVSYATNETAGPVQSFGYDALQRLTSDTLTSASGSVLASEAYGYDSNGNVTSQTTGGGLPNASTTYTYDQADRLASAASAGTTTKYGYDGAGNLTQNGPVTNTYNAQDQLTSSTGSAGQTNYTYTLNGALASAAGSGGTTSYTSDAYGNQASAGGTSYGYDALGRLTSTTTGSSTTSQSYLGTSQTIASDGTDLYSYDPSGNPTAAKPVSGGTGNAVMTDQHGDITAAFSPTSTASGLAGAATYSPWGTVTASSGTMPGIGYQGDYTDPTTGLVHMGARWYNPATGAFTTNDTVGGTPIPITLDGNPYAYADGNPITGTDPTGHLDPGGSVLVDTTPDVGELAAAFDVGFGIGYAAGSAYTCAAGVGACGGMESTVASGLADTMSGMDQMGESLANGFANLFAEMYNSFEPVFDWTNHGYGGWGSSGASGGGGGGGSYGSYGHGYAGSSTAGCTYYCYAPAPPPPPPPPPQDCYAGPHPTCAVPQAPESLLDTQYITSRVKTITSYADLCKMGHCITEHATSHQPTVKGTTGGGNRNTSNTGNGDSNDQQLLLHLHAQGTPPTPTPPRPSPATPNRTTGQRALILARNLKEKNTALEAENAALKAQVQAGSAGGGIKKPPPGGAGTGSPGSPDGPSPGEKLMGIASGVASQVISTACQKVWTRTLADVCTVGASFLGGGFASKFTGGFFRAGAQVGLSVGVLTAATIPCFESLLEAATRKPVIDSCYGWKG